MLTKTPRTPPSELAARLHAARLHKAWITARLCGFDKLVGLGRMDLRRRNAGAGRPRVLWL